MKKLFAMLLALAMVLSMVACQSAGGEKNGEETTPTTTAPAPTDEELLVGTWSYKADLGEIMGTTLAAALGDASLAPDAPLYMEIAFAFNEDGKGALTAKIDQESFKAYMSALVDKMVDILYAAAEAQGMTKEAFDAQYQTQLGMSPKDYMNAQMDAALGSSMEQMESTTELLYKVDSEKGIIYVGEDQAELDSATDGMNYKLEGTKLTVSDIFGENIEEAKSGLEAYGMELPWVFEKQ